MAFFKFRQRGPAEPKAARAADPATSGAASETVESLRRRARHRLIGAVVLVALAVIGFPLLFDTEPRPVTIDAPITIPDRDSVPPLQVPAPAAPAAPEAREAAAPAPPPPAEPGASAAGAVQGGADREAEAAAAREREQAELQARREAEAQARREAEARARQEDEARARARQEEQAKARREAAEREAARARAALEGRDPGPAKPAANGSGRFIVQIGAFAEADAVREVRQKAERAGLKTYTQVVDTKDGKRTRVRVGPFASRAEAEKAAETLKKAGLPGGIFSL